MTTDTRCAIYLRVSSEAQAGKLLPAIRAGATSVLDLDIVDNDKDSLPNQERECRAYAAARGWEVVSVYIEVDTSYHFEDRKQLDRLLAEVRAGRIAVFLGWKLDRVLRDQIHLGVLLDKLRKAGCAFELVKERVEDTTIGRFVLSGLALAAELERENIRMRTQVGVNARLDAGKLPRPSRYPPYGYTWTADHGSYLLNPDEAPVVQRIFRDYRAGNSLLQIARDLTAAGVPTPLGGPWLAGRRTVMLPVA
jgi:site-specific DNA recombinase